jgi:selenium-binding protein 1
MAMAAPPEKLAYVAMLNANGNQRPDALGVVDVDPQSTGYGRLVGQLDMPNTGDELHHFGWNACSASLCPYAPHPHIERRYLVVPGINSSRIHIVDTKPDPKKPQIVKVIEPETLAARTGYASPHTIHCGPEGIYTSALGATNGDGPGGIFVIDHDSFDILGKWELDRGPAIPGLRFLVAPGLRHRDHQRMGHAQHGAHGINPEILLKGGYGHKLHVWDLRKRRHLQELDLGAEYQMALELRPAHDPTRAYGFLGVVVSLKDLSASIWVWHRDDGKWGVKKIIEIPAEPADPEKLPPLLQGFKAVPPLITDINLSLDDRFLYISCWGTGEFLQYDVSDPFHPKKTGSIHLGGIVRHAAHPRAPKTELNGGPQMVELSRDGKRIYFTNSLYSPWDAQFYPEGVRSWMVKLDAQPEGGMELDPKFFLEFGDLRGIRCGWKAATPRPIPTAIHDIILGLAGVVSVGRLPRHQSRHGMAVRGRARDAGARHQSGGSRAGADHPGTRAVHRPGPRAGGLDPDRAAAGLRPDRGGGFALISLGILRILRRRHFAWGGMQVGFRDLTGSGRS